MVLVIIIAMVIFLNRVWIYDWWRGMSYAEASEMATIRDKLELTERGEFLFRASWPKLSDRDEFNAKCRTGDEEMAILGCYTEGDIYVYNIENGELNGIRELTAAHELLHAVWARMSDGEKESLRADLTKVYGENKEILEEDLDNYTSEERYEELYVRAGTEVANLPEGLEKHYAEIFEDQDKVVKYYESYIAVFREMEAEMDGWMTRMTELKGLIDTKTAEYEQRVDALNGKIESFNNCARTTGCFGSAWEFNSQRSVLMAEQEALDALYEEINGLVNEHNELVEKYNADVLRGEKLNEVINSNSKPEEIK